MNIINFSKHLTQLPRGEFDKKLLNKLLPLVTNRIRPRLEWHDTSYCQARNYEQSHLLVYVILNFIKSAVLFNDRSRLCYFILNAAHKLVHKITQQLLRVMRPQEHCGLINKYVG
jgi:hypothetical protein